MRPGGRAWDFTFFMERTMPRTARKKQEPVVESSNGTAPEPKKGPIDLSQLFQNPTAILTVPDPRSDKFVDSGIRIEVSSLYSDDALKAMEEYREKVKIAKANETDPPVLEDAILNQLVSVTKRWWHEGEPTEGLFCNGELLACTPEHKRRVFTSDGWRWLRDFVLVGYTEQANFFGERPKTA
jgi:hypothetical protein